MPNAAVVTQANAAGQTLAAWTVDPSLSGGGGLLAGHEHAIVSAFAGAGKSHHLTRAARHAVNADARVVIIAATNEQVRDLAHRLHKLGVSAVHFAAHGEEIPAPPAGLVSSRDLSALRHAPCLVATVHQAGKLNKEHSKDIGAFDVGFVDEAFQVASRNEALQALHLAARWAYVGDPGQIEVFTRLGTSPFKGVDDPVTSIVTSARAQGGDFGEMAFDWTWRLPENGAPMLAPFYGRPVTAAAAVDDRALILGPERLSRRGTLERAAEHTVDRAATLGWGYLELAGDPLDAADPTTAGALATVVHTLLARNPEATCERDGTRPLTGADIGVMVSTDAQRAMTEQALSAAGHSDIGVRTFNSAQGLEFAVSVLWHPLSGVEEADAFSLDMGRLCVGVSRHRQACILVGQRGLRTMLEDPPTSSEAPWPGQPDRLLGGWLAHTTLVEQLDNLGATTTI